MAWPPRAAGSYSVISSVLAWSRRTGVGWKATLSPPQGEWLGNSHCNQSPFLPPTYRTYTHPPGEGWGLLNLLLSLSLCLKSCMILFRLGLWLNNRRLIVAVASLCPQWVFVAFGAQRKDILRSVCVCAQTWFPLFAPGLLLFATRPLWTGSHYCDVYSHLPPFAQGSPSLSLCCFLLTMRFLWQA